VTFPKIYHRNFSCVNDVSMMIDVSIATVYSRGVLTIFRLLSVFFSVFPLRLSEGNSLLFVLVLIKDVSKYKFIYFSMTSLSTV